jgi:hypothetical protein
MMMAGAAPGAYLGPAGVPCVIERHGAETVCAFLLSRQHIQENEIRSVPLADHFRLRGAATDAYGQARV